MVAYLILAILTTILVIIMILLAIFWEEAKKCGGSGILIFGAFIFTLMSIMFWSFFKIERVNTEYLIKDVGNYKVDTIIVSQRVNNIETRDTTYNITYTKKNIK